MYKKIIFFGDFFIFILTNLLIGLKKIKFGLFDGKHKIGFVNIHIVCISIICIGSGAIE
jgi:hypothetical protein